MSHQNLIKKIKKKLKFRNFTIFDSFDVENGNSNIILFMHFSKDSLKK